MGTDKSVKLGVLAIQGAFSEHKNAFARCSQLMDVDINVVEIRSISDIELDLDGIILPGGESTVMGKMLSKDGFGERLKSFVKGQMTTKPPHVFGTCGGLIMLANNLEQEKTGGQYNIGGIDVTVSRNFFGRQVNSFEGPVVLNKEIFEKDTFGGVFIRAPAVLSCDDDKVTTLGCVENKNGGEDVIVAVQQDNLLAMSFHPELTDDVMWHKYFIEMILSSR